MVNTLTRTHPHHSLFAQHKIRSNGKQRIDWRCYYGSELNLLQCGNYFIPNIRLAHTGTQTLGKYGRMRRIFLEQNKPMIFNDMVLTETLFPHLWEVQQTCENRMDLLMVELFSKKTQP